MCHPLSSMCSCNPQSSSHVTSTCINTFYIVFMVISEVRETWANLIFLDFHQPGNPKVDY